ncbi:hypothetical protein [Variovorax sp. PDC80]|jgi:hypothetical protein|uniref:hypothetical protein n=1 Tax=Variovorax sp. PDC80 TaxID=1882827 RepID=UPI0011606D66|nr:hypothetical protein [Variovorax sp. PDC80]
MAVLIAAENVGIGCAGWVYRTILSEISQVLAERGHDALATWLSDENASVHLYGCLDARTFTPANQEAFLSALVIAQERSEANGPTGWRDPTFWPGYSDLFASLAGQAKQAAQGGPLIFQSNLSAFDEHDDSLRSGPGWPGQDAN